LAAVVHRLAGSAGMLGFTKVSAKAGALEDAFCEDPPNLAVRASALQELLALIEATLAEPGSNS